MKATHIRYYSMVTGLPLKQYSSLSLPQFQTVSISTVRITSLSVFSIHNKLRIGSDLVCKLAQRPCTLGQVQIEEYFPLRFKCKPKNAYPSEHEDGSIPSSPGFGGTARQDESVYLKKKGIFEASMHFTVVIHELGEGGRNRSRGIVP